MMNRIIVYQSKFFYLLLSLIIYFISVSLMTGDNTYDLSLSLLFSFIVLICIYVVSSNPFTILSTLILGFISVTCHWTILLKNPGINYYIILYGTNIILLSIITYSVLSVVAGHRQITANSLFGAICGYFLIGFTWTFIYLLIATLNHGAFSDHMITPSIHESTQHFFYFSFCTMTTIGYGDVLPLSNVARTFAWLEAMTGQAYLAVWISQLVGLRIMQENQVEKMN